MINKKTFAFEQKPKIIDGSIGSIHLGGIPNNNHLNFPQKGYIKINQKEDRWTIPLEGVQHENSYYFQNLTLAIHSGKYGFIISDQMFELMENKILKQKIKMNACWRNYNNFECELNAFNPNETISFKFGDTMMTFSLVSLFKKYENNLESYFQMNSSPYVNSSALLGVHFLELFNYTVFDYENRQVEFYSDTILIKKEHNKKEFPLSFIIWYIYIVIDILCFLSVLLGIVNKLLNKNNKI